MNTKITALTLAAATAFAFTPKSASAGNNDGAAIFGAIVGGALIGAAIASANDCAPVYVNSTYCPPPPVVYAPPPVVYAPAPVVYGGYWTTTTVNVWVPGAWVVERDRYGNNCRRYVAGHYTHRNERRWVAHNNHRYDNRGGHSNRHSASNHSRDRRDNDRHDNRNDNRRGHR